MDQNTCVQELKDVVQKFCTERDWDQFHSAKDLAIGASTEANELLELFRFKSEAEVTALLADPAFRGKAAHELADVLFFILRFAQKYDFDLAAAFHEKMRQNGEKYSVEKARGSNRKYNEA